MTIRTLNDRGFRFIAGPMQYSGGVAAEPGYRLIRVRFARVLPMQEGWAAIAGWLAAQGLPKTAFCACELRSPAPFTEAGFLEFNTGYADVLREWGVLADGSNPVARSNVCPALDPPAQPGFHAFTVCAAGEGGGFVVSGSGETPEGGNYSDSVVARGDTSPAGMHAKAEFVLAEMGRRMAKLDARWSDVTATQAYAVHEMAPLLSGLMVPAGAVAHGLVWHWARPPVVGLEFEMDVRGVADERVIVG